MAVRSSQGLPQLSTMETFAEYLEKESHIFEMATLSPKEHKFGINVKIHILQPGDKKLPHGPRLKILKNNTELFVITLPKIGEPEIIGNTQELKKQDVSILLSTAKQYREAFVRFWFDSYMSVDELMNFVDSINKHDQDRIQQFRKEHKKYY